MPALNIIATQDTVLNSGSSSSPPSGMLPNRPAPSQITNTTKAEATSTNSQPVLCTVHPSELLETEARLEVFRKPHSTNATASTAVTPNTTLSNRPLRSCAGSGSGVCSAGCESVASPWRSSSSLPG